MKSRRTPEQQIADLEAKIQAVKARAERAKVKKDPAIRHVAGALRSIDKALGETDDRATRDALTEARGGMVAVLGLHGIVAPAGTRRVAPKAVLEHIEANPGASAADLAHGLGTDVATLRPALAKLKASGQARTEGKARGVKYYVGGGA